ncbi:MAG TPA: DUF192 domain-containing protein [Rhizomicrobium sp.]|jgi:hypothetical protein
MRGLLLFVIAAVALPSAAMSGATLPVTTVVVDTEHGPVRFTMEVASDQASQEKGLMFRTKLAPDAGMLFDVQPVQMETFWMKNTVLPLDIIFIRADGVISSIAPNATPYSETPIPSYEPVRAVLEINGGRAETLGITPGERVHHALFHDALPGQR